MLEVARLVLWNLLLSVSVTCSGDKNRSVDDETTEIFKGLLEARNSGIGRPEIWTQVLGEVLGRELWCRFGA
jgi:hypothetical protein